MNAREGSPSRPRAPGLLVVGLQALGQIHVGHEAHVRLVDAHAEGDGGHHYQALLLEEPVLVLRAHVLVQARVVGQGVVALPPQPLGQVLDPAAGQDVDDAAVPLVLRDEPVELLPGVLLGRHRVADLRAIEAGGEDPVRGQVQPLHDVPPGGLVRGGGEGQAGHPREALLEDGELLVLGAEVVPPHGDAVGLVDGEQGDPDLGEELQGGVHEQPLRRDVEEIEAPGAKGSQDVAALVRGHRGVERTGLHPQLDEGLHLVAHERDEGRDDHRGALHAQGRDLVAQGLPASGGHEHEPVAPVHHVVDDPLLEPAERGVSEDRGEDLAGVLAHGRTMGGMKGGVQGHCSSFGDAPDDPSVESAVLLESCEKNGPCRILSDIRSVSGDIFGAGGCRNG